MSRELIHSLPQLASLFDTIDSYNLGDVVWAVLGGIPIVYVRLSDVARGVGRCLTLYPSSHA